MNIAEVFKERYSLANLKIPCGEFLAWLNSNQIWGEEWMTPYAKFTDTSRWGHDHDFGDGVFVKGSMGDRHLWIMQEFLNRGYLPSVLTGKKALVVGCYTGGDALALGILSPKIIHGVEEVKKYADIAKKLFYAFDPVIDSAVLCGAIWGSVESESCMRQFVDRDIVYMAGVLYHLRNPMLGLQNCWRALKPGGTLYLETMTSENKKFDGPALQYTGDQDAGYNYFVPNVEAMKRMLYDSRFNVVDCWESHASRALFVATKVEDIVRDRR